MPKEGYSMATEVQDSQDTTTHTIIWLGVMIVVIGAIAYFAL